METFRRTVGPETEFGISGLDPAYHQAAIDLAYRAENQCFVKSFPTKSPNLDLVYQNFSRSIESVILQTAGVALVPWEQAIDTFLHRIDGEPINWWLCGSAALAVRGAPITPRDVDLIVDDSSAHRLGTILLDGLIEPVIPVQGWFCNWWGRAFFGSRIEWVGGVGPQADQPEISDFGPEASEHLETVCWHRRDIRVPPLELQLQVSLRRGLIDRANLIRKLMDSR